ncbi:MAG TPA: response regulator transcription factor [Pseudonocardia sp.]|jgi:DNA-binding NarL/FixJ family response regulator|nr:response regulator transcription factor [Pseudonocardia sp.]
MIVAKGQEADMGCAGPTGPIGVVVVGGTWAGGADVLDGDGFTLLDRVVDPAAAPVAVVATNPQVVVVEMGAAAVAAIAELTAAAPHTPVLAVAATDDHDQVLAAVQAGAAGYVVHTGRIASLVDAVRRTAAGEAVFSPGLAAVVLEARSAGGSPAAVPARLTERESDVLRLVVDGLTSRQIATRLVLSPRTVENHIQNILRKVELGNRAALVRYAIENGLA